MASLSIVGTGIRLVAHLTAESRAEIVTAEKLLYLVPDRATARYLSQLNDTAGTLAGFYVPDKPRRAIYDEIVDHTLAWLRRGVRTCVAYYGHPGVLCYPGHESIRRARLEGHQARMFPGVSAQDCIFSDLGIDPGVAGLQSYAADDLVSNRRMVDTRTPLIIWQPAVVGENTANAQPRPDEILRLQEHLATFYDLNHEVILYEASLATPLPEVIRTMPLGALGQAVIEGVTTLVVLPIATA